ncbi:glycosyltransferase family 2 protein [bacterium]|nr:glycosyltransferase family 2 protein [bacterium]
MTDLSIIIVTRNNDKEIIQCLRSIYESKTEYCIKIFVIDNNSSDRTKQVIAEAFTDVQLITNPDNPGFGRASNQGLKLSHAKYVLFLNPDTLLYKDSLDKMIIFLESHQQIALLGPKILNEDGAIQQECLRDYPSITNELISLLRLDRFLGIKPPILYNYEQSQIAKVLSGACLLGRQKIIKELGGFDKNFFLYGEDIDLCRMIQKEGYNLYYQAETQVTHLAHRSINKEPDFSPQTISCWSLYMYFKKHHGYGYATLYRFVVAATSCISIGIYAISFQFIRHKKKKSALFHDLHKLRWATTLKIKGLPC